MKKTNDHETGADEGTALQDTPRLPAAVEQEVVRFMEFHPVDRLQKNLRRMLFDFLMYQGSLEAVYLRDLVEDLDGLFDLLDVMESVGKAGTVVT